MDRFPLSSLSLSCVLVLVPLSSCVLVLVLHNHKHGAVAARAAGVLLYYKRPPSAKTARFFSLKSRQMIRLAPIRISWPRATPQYSLYFHNHARIRIWAPVTNVSQCFQVYKWDLPSIRSKTGLEECLSRKASVNYNIRYTVYILI